MWLLYNASNSEKNHPNSLSPVLTKFYREQRGYHELWQHSQELDCRKSMCSPFRGDLVKNSILYWESWMLNLFSVLLQFMSQMHSCSPFSRQSRFRFSQSRFCRVWTILGSESTHQPVVYSWHHQAEMGQSTTSPTAMNTQTLPVHFAAVNIMGFPWCSGYSSVPWMLWFRGTSISYCGSIPFSQINVLISSVFSCSISGH